MSEHFPYDPWSRESHETRGSEPLSWTQPTQPTQPTHPPQADTGWLFSEPVPSTPGWPGSASYGPRARRKPLLSSTAVLAIAMVVVGGGAGAAIGHEVWSKGASTSASATAPAFGNFGGGSGTSGGSNGLPGSNGSGNSGAPSGSSGATGPSDAATIAKNVSPGLVDITTTLGYQNAEAAGTGMVLTSNGLVLTNNHVISGATKISVRDVGNGRTYTATVVGYDRTEDVAVLQLNNASGLTTVTPATSVPSQGAAVVGIGNAGGTGGTPSYAGGSITATDQSITASDEGDGTSETLTGLLETDANIQPGDSGGPLVDTQGHVVGMDTAASQSFQFNAPSGSSGGGQGFAIPIQKALSIASQIEAGKASTLIHIGPTALLGVNVQSASVQGNGGFGGNSNAAGAGAVIAQVVSGGPADAAGLTGGDVITSLDGHAIDSGNTLTQVMSTERPGNTVNVQYTDNSGQQQTASVHLASGPPQ